MLTICRSRFHPLQSSSFSFLFSLGFSPSSITARVSLAFMYFYAFKSISVIVLEGSFAIETTNSLDFNPALKIISCTLSFASSNSKVSWVKRVTYDPGVSFSPCLMVCKWSASLFRCFPPIQRKELPSYSKLLMDNVGSLVNHSLAAPLRMVGKEKHSISLRGCWRPKVVLKVLRWSKRSLNSSNGSSYGRRNFKCNGHSRTAVVKGESVLLTILSRLQSIFSLIAFLNSSISLLISLRRSELPLFGVTGRLFWLSPSSS